MWDPTTYLAFADERSRPFTDLLARVGAEGPRTVLDLGCGPATLTRGLADRWPRARVLGVDSSPEMVERAQALVVPGGCDVVLGDVRTWTPPPGTGPVDVVVTNATLQWVPDHLGLLERWVDWLEPGGWLAVQVPSNFDAPSHVLMREVAAREPWRVSLEGVLRHGDAVAEPETYLARLAAAGCDVDVWQTTYAHVLPGDDAVLGWVRGTGLRPVLAALAPAEAAAFEAAYAAELRAAYPREPHGTVFGFRRTFAVAQKRGGPTAAPPLVDGLHHVELACPAGSEDALRAFYVGVLGMVEQPKPPVLAARGGVWFRSGRAELHLGVEEPFAPAKKAHPGLVVSDLDAVVERLASAGLPAEPDRELPGFRRVYTSDPVGNRVELLEPTG